jgi:tetratricopeptide (TPR) repeat protein
MPDTHPPLLSAKELIEEAKRHHQAGRLHEAELLFEKVITLDPRHAETLHWLGAIAYQDGRYDAAIERIGKAIAIDPTNALYHSNLGTALRELGQYEQAVASYRNALRIKPNFAEAHYNLGIALKGIGWLDGAIAAYRTAIRIKPDFAEAHLNSGNALMTLNWLDDAIAAYRLAIHFKPDYVEAHLNVGNALRDQGRYEDAIAAYHTAISYDSNCADAYCNLGIALKESGNLDDAVTAYGTALKLRPDYADAHSNLGNLLTELACFNDALDAFATAIRIEPNLANAHFNESRTRLLLGDFRLGWQKFEWRWDPEFKNFDKRKFDRPRWDGSPLNGKRILIHAEQGLGDTIQFCRYVEMVASRGGRVVLEVPPQLVRLLSKLRGVDTLAITGNSLPEYDFHCPLMSLPLVFGTELDTIPADIPYLPIDPIRIAQWRDKLGTHSSLRVGLTWAGNPRRHMPSVNAIDRQRSLQFTQLISLLDLPSIEFYSLQLGDDAASQLNGHPRVVDHTPALTDFCETAALIANLDLVISVDTSVAHLAGAMGKPIWLLNRHNSCWRWMVDRNDTPWYPTMRIFRQPSLGDWENAIRDIRLALEQECALWKPD